MKLWWLLVSRFSYLPIPRRWQAGLADLPRALPLLPLYGLLTGLLLAAAALLSWPLGLSWQAILLLTLSILTNGAVWLRDVLSVASGLQPPPAAPFSPALPTDNVPPPAAPAPLFNRAALLTGGAYLLLHYICFLLLLRSHPHPAVYVAGAVSSRFIYLWGVYDFAALPPAFLHRAFTRRAFGRSALASLVLVATCSVAALALLPALLPPLCAASLFYRRRLRAVGAVDEAAYGAAAAWGEIMLYLSFIVFSTWL